MKELSTEEKARRYDGAIKRLEDIETGKCQKTFMFTEGLFDYIFPELKESEDERIRKEIIAHIKWCEDSGYCAKEEMIRWITFLEKQAQKPAWSEEDEQVFNTITNSLDRRRVERVWHTTIEEVVNWLKSLKDRVQPQSQWKPSEEQMEALLKLEEMHVLEHENSQENAHLYMVVKSIREQLKKLREE